MDKEYEFLIRPNRNWAKVDFLELYAYRDLLWQLVYRDFNSRFKQTLLGPLWYIISPLLTTGVFVLVFGHVMGVTPSGVPALLFYNSGLIAWSYFSNVLLSTGNSLQGNIHLFGKVYFPRLIVPIAQVFSNMIGFFIQLLTFGILLIYVWKTDPNIKNLQFGVQLLWLPVLVTHIACLALGIGLAVSALTAKYRDMQNALGFVVSTLMYITPVMWPLARIEAKFPQYCGLFVLFNPLVGIVEAFRCALIGVGSFKFSYYAISVLTSVLVLIFGVALFQRAARSFVDQA